MVFAQDVERLKAEGFELIKLKNRGQRPVQGNQQSVAQSRRSGVRFEVQFHTQESLEAKELTHKAYERIRSSASAVRARESSKDFSVRSTAMIVTLRRTRPAIEDYPGEEVMAEKITYYAIIDEFSSREQPVGVLRRSRHDEGERDETFGARPEVGAHVRSCTRLSEAT